MQSSKNINNHPHYETLSPVPGLASWVCNPCRCTGCCVWQSPRLILMLCCHYWNSWWFWNRGSAFLFCTGLCTSQTWNVEAHTCLTPVGHTAPLSLSPLPPTISLIQMSESLLITGGFRCIIRVLEFISYFLSSPDLLFLLSFFLPYTPNVDNCQDRVAKMT